MKVCKRDLASITSKLTYVRSTRTIYLKVTHVQKKKDKKKTKKVTHVWIIEKALNKR